MPGHGGHALHPLTGAEVVQIRPADTGRAHAYTRGIGGQFAGRIYVLEAQIPDAVQANGAHALNAA